MKKKTGGRIFGRGTEFKGGFQNFPELRRIFPGFREFSGAAQNFPERPGILQRLAEFFRRRQNLPETPVIFRNATESSGAPWSFTAFGRKFGRAPGFSREAQKIPGAAGRFCGAL